MDPVVVVGAGISGVACARVLAESEIPVRLLDRGRRIGGRMASKQWEDRPVDLGASYFTVRDPAFAAVAEDWRQRGLAAPWTDTFAVLGADGPARLSTGPVRWAAPRALRSLVEDLATGLPLERTEVNQVCLDGNGSLDVDGVRASAVVLAMPDAQAIRLLDPVLVAGLDLVERRYDPVIALVAWWAARTWDDISPNGRFEGAFVNDDDTLGWIADDGRRRGDDAAVLVAHSTTAFAAAHLADPVTAEQPMVAAVRRLLGLGAPQRSHVHRWSLARPAGERSESFRLTSELLGLCGDGWGPEPKVETAWLSGRAVGRALAARLG